jgi:hypothetical protein
VAVQLVWRHPQRREVEMVLYITMRMVHLRGWRRVVVADDLYRRTETIEELLAMAGQWNELYVDGGVAGFLGAYERQMERDEETRRRARDQRR